MNPKLHVLAIDDHVVVLEGYHYMFQNLDHNHGELKFVKARDCKTGYKVISANHHKPFDIALIDYSIPQYEDQQLHTGADLARLVRETMPDCKIILMTMHKEIDIIGSILNTIDPEGFINKSDCSTEELAQAFKEVLNGNTFYSQAISNYLKRRKKGIVLEDIDVRIILLLAKGIKNKNLSNYIPLSESAIEKRKYKIKRLLEIEGNDEDLIHEARTQGFI
ncbi:response regulator [Flavobacterium psychrotrophum]|uniref:response regulator n=1 Tax=Flavobacterium psychrotrophum TaxID=2294119 RepID=UPI0013C3F962|nr:response regulator [Flavobacterium psychrotrophum]